MMTMMMIVLWFSLFFSYLVLLRWFFCMLFTVIAPNDLFVLIGCIYLLWRGKFTYLLTYTCRWPLRAKQ